MRPWRRHRTQSTVQSLLRYETLFAEASTLHILYERPSGNLNVRVHDVPGALSGNIFRLRANIPSLSSHSAIDGDKIFDIPILDFGDVECPEEDTHDIVANLPLMAFDEQIHFARVSKFRSEVPNLRLATELPHVVQLLGRTDDGRIVFPKSDPGSAWYWCQRRRLQASFPPTSSGRRRVAFHRYMSSRPDSPQCFCVFWLSDCLSLWPRMSGWEWRVFRNRWQVPTGIIVHPIYRKVRCLYVRTANDGLHTPQQHLDSLVRHLMVAIGCHHPPFVLLFLIVRIPSHLVGQTWTRWSLYWWQSLLKVGSTTRWSILGFIVLFYRRQQVSIEGLM